jgi:hypothetical protein
VQLRQDSLRHGIAFAVAALASAGCSSSTASPGGAAVDGSADAPADGSVGGSTPGDAGSDAPESAAATDGSGGVTDSSRCDPVASLPTLPATDASYFGQTFCPFLPEASTPSEHHCATGDHCCEGPEGTDSVCTPSAQSCGTAPGSIDWSCQYPGAGQCAAGELCCATATLVVTGASSGDAGCGNYVTGLTKTSCYVGASCPAGDIQMCATDSDCPSGERCNAFEAGDIKQLGACQ